MKLLIIDELSMASGDLWRDIDAILWSRLSSQGYDQGCGCGLSVMTARDLLRLPAVRQELIFSQISYKDSAKHLLGR